MFEKRLTAFWIVLTCLSLVIIGRLVHIQVFEAESYAQLAERILTRHPVYIPAPRGAIHDRNGTPLLRDAATANVNVHFAVIAYLVNPEPETRRLRRYLARKVARPLRRRGEFPQELSITEIVDGLVDADMPLMWERLAVLTGHTAEQMRSEADFVYRRIRKWSETAGQPVREENQLLPLIEGIDDEAVLAIQLELERYPWLRVMPASQRIATNADTLPHLLGRLGSASPTRIEDDPLAGDELRELRRGDRCGTSGVERMAETTLRGQRGRIISDYDWRVLEHLNPMPGRDVHLTIDVDLQQAAFKAIERAIEGDPEQTPPGGLAANVRAGGAAVVIDVESREVLALASYPTYAVDTFNQDYDAMRRDRRRLPLTFRPVQAAYPPGSTCKLITLIAGLGEGAVGANERLHCHGHYLPNRQNVFRCWIYKLNPGITHDMIVNPNGLTGEEGIMHSCNCYFFKIGERLGPDRLLAWFERFGLGRAQGTGLIAERRGIVPTEAWLADPRRGNPRRYRPSDPWNFSIGQGEVTATPLQVANVGAAVAGGYWAPVILARDDEGRPLGASRAPREDFNESHLRVARRGMWRSVNDRGTGRWARLDSDEYELCGKTGSAQSVRRVLRKRYIFEWPDGHRDAIEDISLRDAQAHFGVTKPRLVDSQVIELFPRLEEGEALPAHAWFLGYTQAKGTPRGARPTGRVYAIAVLIEYGGSGGRVAGPVAKEIAEHLLGIDSGAETDEELSE